MLLSVGGSAGSVSSKDRKNDEQPGEKTKLEKLKLQEKMVNQVEKRWERTNPDKSRQL